MKTFWKVLKWVVIFLGTAFVVLVIGRAIYLYKQEKVDAIVENIHTTKLSLNDVMGKNLPPDPGAEADKTIAGVDANQNGIRDDVELAIFEKYPNSAKTRAVLLQYALALQMEVTQPFFNKEIVTAVAQEQSRGFSCVGTIVNNKDLDVLNSYINSIKEKQFNTDSRTKNRKEFFNNKLGSYKALSGCDINLSKL